MEDYTISSLSITNYFYWEKFSTVEVIKFKLQSLFYYLACKLLDGHCWSVEITPWTFDEITSVEQFRNRRARNFKCDFCGKEEHISDVDMTSFEKLVYEKLTWQFYHINNPVLLSSYTQRYIDNDGS